MAKVKDLVQLSAAVAADWIYIVDDGAGVSGGKKMTVADLEASLPIVTANAVHTALVVGNPHGSTTDNVLEGATNNYANTAGGQADITGNTTVAANAVHAALTVGNPHGLDSVEVTEGASNFYADTTAGQAEITGNTEVLASTAHLTVNNNPHKSPILFTLNEDNRPYLRIRNNASTLIASLPFPGTTKMGTPTNITVDHTIRPGDTAVTITLELRDLGTGNVIANVNLPAPTVEGINDIGFDLGALANLPAGRGVIEVYGNNNGGNLQGWLSGIEIDF